MQQQQAVVSDGAGFVAGVGIEAFIGTVVIPVPVGQRDRRCRVSILTFGMIDSLYENGIGAVGQAITDGKTAVVDTGKAIADGPTSGNRLSSSFGLAPTIAYARFITIAVTCACW